jgi:predicted nucleic acid-binding Zn ribbon protein
LFKRDVKQLHELIMRNLRVQGLETPLLQKRLVEAWPIVAGSAIARYTQDAAIRNQTLFVRLSSPALRAELSMRRQELVNKLNDAVGSQVIADIRFH